ncbi:MAG TPA: permease [Pseudolabrys sp.]|nr:permease [Pseudolabrys sp.]
MSASQTLAFLAGHEFRLGWRDWVSLLTAGRRTRLRTAVIGVIAFVAVMHLIAYTLVARYAASGVYPDKPTLVMVTGTMLLSWSLLLSQAMESVTREFYARSDLDLILTSPVSPRAIFSVRIGRIAVSVTVVAMLLGAPFIDMLAFFGGAQWLAAYCVVAAMGAAAAAFAVAITVALFRLIGAKRTRLIAQIVAAVIGAAFVIGLQVAAILSYGNLSRLAPLRSEWLIAHAPDLGNAMWWPARAVLGDLLALVAVAAAAFGLLGVSIAIFSRRFGDHALAAAGISQTVVRQRRWSRGFRRASPHRVLRRKEWTLLRRDPWLMSQTLMQILYLLPPALMLWQSFREGIGASVVLVPVMVMAAGQLAGGLAWLSISGEDAPDLVASAPVTARRVLWAKIEAVLGAIALTFGPLILALAFASPWSAAMAGSGILIATASATSIQLFFRVQARRSHFRRRQTSSRLATLAEAFSSITWAAAAGLAAAGTWFAVIPALIALGILGGARAVSPPPK